MDAPSTTRGSDAPRQTVLHLPIQTTSFVGRERETSEVIGLVRQARVCTLVGPGGCGKTRLALRVAAAASDDYPDGVRFVDLGSLEASELVPQRVATSLGLREWPERSHLDAIVEHLKEKRTLVLLDTCEHVLEGCAVLIDAIVRAAPAVTILATSREPLRLAEEVVWQVPPLTESAAVLLFEVRGQRVAPAFVLHRGNRPSVAAICRRLDNIPLAIELAAARLNVLAPAQILARLQDRFRLLSVGARNAPQRHRSLQATLDWSLQLLSTTERALFRRLAVFRGGFTIDAAEAIAGDDGIDVVDVLDLVASLVNKSIVIAGDAGDPARRYRMLDTIREYALGLLDESGEADRIRERHARHFMAFAVAWPVFGTIPETTWRSSAEVEQDNLRAALDWLRVRDPTLALRMAGRLLTFWDTGRYTEGRRLLKELLETGGNDPQDRAWALVALGHLAEWQEDYAEARAVLDEGLRLAEEAGDRSALSFAFGGLSNFARWAGDADLTRRLGERFHAEGEYQLRPMGLAIQGQGAYIARDLAQSRAFLEKAVEEARHAGNPWIRGFAHAVLHQIDVRERRYDDSAEHLKEAAILLTPFNDVRLLVTTVQFAAELAALRGQHRRALRMAAAGHELAEKQGVNSRYRARRAETMRQLADLVGSDAMQVTAQGRALSLVQALDEVVSLSDRSPTRVEQKRPGGLTSRERQIAAMVARGMTNREIASKLVIALRTVDAHVEHIRNKLGFHSRTQIAAWAVDRGLLAPGSPRGEFDQRSF